ncbi:MAG: molybdopterin-binding protein [Magnetospirillum sp. WYHS-4]
MSEPRTYTACVIVIGNEVLSGRTRDANIQFLGARLNDLGIRLVEARVLRDDEAAIVAAVDECRARYDYVFTTGGIGPTHDDITAACIAKAFGRPLVRDPQAEALLLSHYRPDDVNPARLRMADVPAGSILIDNPVSRAPGFQVENVFVLAGVPMIAQAMFEGLKDRLAGGVPQRARTVSGFTPEGGLAGDLAAVQNRHPAVEIGSYPFIRQGRLGVSLVARSTDDDALEAAVADLKALIAARGTDPLEETPP